MLSILLHVNIALVLEYLVLDWHFLCERLYHLQAANNNNIIQTSIVLLVVK